MIQFDEEKHSEGAMLLLGLEDSLGVMGSGEFMKSLVFFDIGKLEEELVQIVKQEEVCTLHNVHMKSFIFDMGMGTVILSLSYSFRVSYSSLCIL